jgi:hypothetical protein
MAVKPTKLKVVTEAERVALLEKEIASLEGAFTLQGWLKGVNGIVQTSATDMGQDGLSTNTSRKYVGRDAPLVRDVSIVKKSTPSV